MYRIPVNALNRIYGNKQPAGTSDGTYLTPFLRPRAGQNAALLKVPTNGRSYLVVFGGKVVDGATSDHVNELLALDVRT